MIVQRPAWLAGGFALLLSAAGATGQGTFQNLGFESARVSGYAPGAYIPITAGLPGWAAGVDGSNKSATIYYDTQSLGGALISVNDANTGSGFTPIDGTFSAYLFSQGLGSPIATSISQTALVPGGITRAALSTCGRAKTKFLSLNYERARTQTDKD